MRDDDSLDLAGMERLQYQRYCFLSVPRSTMTKNLMLEKETAIFAAVETLPRRGIILI